MNKISLKIEEIINQLPDKEANLALENRFPYIFTKASYFLNDGPKLYSEKDAFKLPDDSFSANDLALITNGCSQLIKGIGFSMDNPLKDIGIRGCNKLFQLFHFELVNQQAYKQDNGFLDQLIYRHAIDKKEIIYYNLVN